MSVTINRSCFYLRLLFIAPSSPVINLTATAFNATSIRVNWFPPPLSEWNGIINYTITFTSNDEFITHNGSILADESIDPRTAASEYSECVCVFNIFLCSSIRNRVFYNYWSS